MWKILESVLRTAAEDLSVLRWRGWGVLSVVGRPLPGQLTPADIILKAMDWNLTLTLVLRLALGPGLHCRSHESE